MSADLPPLPEPAGNGITVFGDEFQRDYTYSEDSYTADQMHAYALQERAAERERCARHIDVPWTRSGNEFAAAIREQQP